MTPAEIWAATLYVAAAAMQIFGLVRAWVKTRNLAAREAETLEELRRIGQVHDAETEQFYEYWNDHGGMIRNPDFTAAQEVLNARHEQERAAAGLRPLTWFYHDTAVNQVWTSVFSSARDAYKMEGLFIIGGILIGLMASLVTLIPW